MHHFHPGKTVKRGRTADGDEGKRRPSDEFHHGQCNDGLGNEGDEEVTVAQQRHGFCRTSSGTDESPRSLSIQHNL